ncbi:MAG: nucleotidyltransferase domain-containing protein [Nitrososphaeria archaeon]|nr:nucleotidyltransferase domain-containing protein [Nitrososphaeria archaeon]
MLGEIQEKLLKILESEEVIVVAYIFGSLARGYVKPESDYDIGILLSKIPENLLDYYLHLINRLSHILGDRVDLLILNNAPPTLIYQVIKYGKAIYVRDERARITFEAKATSEYLDFSRALKRYYECLMG